MSSVEPTPSDPGTGVPDSGQGTAQTVPAGLPAEALESLGTVLDNEHAAVWGYGLVAGFDKANAALYAVIRNAHLARRDQLVTIITASGGSPSTAAPWYQVPAVTDQKSALALALELETDCATAWHAVIGNTDIAELRGLGLSGLTDAATFMTRIKTAGKINPSTIALPGAPA
ncbi:DUF4439 domain-containing protein [Nakamurella sp. YIM 132087]|uniref:DUF4439 domain-containing protein n=1 Tax=Nakamurella alba TaxID=2665158 RepID=A0A7K1FKE2_9ACTN|nr:ferritin-like domain-containing protein [Nakamurella alba]MTD13713.1 DUF4439 domain-containing protein [Nakamurella alba]